VHREIRDLSDKNLGTTHLRSASSVSGRTEVIQRERISLICEQLRRAASDPLSCAGDDGYFRWTTHLFKKLPSVRTIRK
jgi:hypothetical protein